jgi:hypothetical protein
MMVNMQMSRKKMYVVIPVGRNDDATLHLLGGEPIQVQERLEKVEKEVKEIKGQDSKPLA